jgi:hypothetical protein
MGMYTLFLFLAVQVATPGEMACLGFVQDFPVSMDVYIAGMQDEGSTAYAVEGQILLLNGPKVSELKAGEIQRVIRPEGSIRDRAPGGALGVYHKDIGTVRIETVGGETATARVIMSCQGMLKGDVVTPDAAKPVIEYGGELSNVLTPIPEQGIFGSILFGKDDIREMTAGNFAFIGLGGRDGIKPGDRFTIFRPYPEFNSKETEVEGEKSRSVYSPLRNSYTFRSRLSEMLSDRSLPPKVLGDFVVLHAGNEISAGKIVNSLREIHPGDYIVKR